MDTKAERLLGDYLGNHWFYRAKGEAMRRLLAAQPVRHVLDVGAGSGVFSRLLLDHGAAEATCIDPAYPAQFETSHGGKPIRFVHRAEDSTADVVLLMDVLEHAEDDVGLLRGYANGAAPGTRFLMAVPAFPWMWGGHDVYLERRRRYTLAMLETVARKSGLRPVGSCYFYGLTLPLAAGRRAIMRLSRRGAPPAKSDLQRHSKWMNALLYGLCRIELLFFARNRAAGLTVFCLAER